MRFKKIMLSVEFGCLLDAVLWSHLPYGDDQSCQGWLKLVRPARRLTAANSSTREAAIAERLREDCGLSNWHQTRQNIPSTQDWEEHAQTFAGGIHSTEEEKEGGQRSAVQLCRAF